MRLFRRILVATDFSAGSRVAFDRAVVLARAAGAPLVIAHVLAPVGPVPGDGAFPGLYEQMASAIRADGSKKLEALVSRARRARVRTKGALLEGAPHDALVRSARRHGADLIVMGTHGRTGIRRILLGSVASRVVATAPCPVLTVRASRR